VHVAEGGHFTVLLEEAVASLALREGGAYLDGTFGGGGHSRLILQHEPSVGALHVVDADPAAIARAEALAVEPVANGRLHIIHANFGDLADVAAEQTLPPFDGMLFDLGVSSFQLDEGDRGFSFRFDGPLDMRFDPTTGSSAADLVNALDAEDLAQIFWRYGDESRSRRIAAAIVTARQDGPITTTARLAGIVSDAVGGRQGRGTHPATKTFQALRIAVNRELEMLDRVLETSLDLLAPGGRLVVIAFHSLEDRIVKRFIERETATCICPPEQPFCTCDHQPRLKRLGKPVKPSDHELQINARSRSAIMRVAERLPDVTPDSQEEAE